MKCIKQELQQSIEEKFQVMKKKELEMVVTNYIGEDAASLRYEGKILMFPEL